MKKVYTKFNFLKSIKSKVLIKFNFYIDNAGNL